MLCGTDSEDARHDIVQYPGPALVHGCLRAPSPPRCHDNHAGWPGRSGNNYVHATDANLNKALAHIEGWTFEGVTNTCVYLHACGAIELCCVELGCVRVCLLRSAVAVQPGGTGIRARARPSPQHNPLLQRWVCTRMRARTRTHACTRHAAKHALLTLHLTV